MITTSISIESGPDVKMSHLNQAVTESLKSAVRGWHSQVAPGHFKSGAGRKYKYKPRSVNYQRYKNRLGKKPLTFSGKAKNQLLRTIKPTGSKGLIKGKFITSSSIRYFWQTPPGHPNKGEELVTVTKSEERQIGKAVEDMTVKNLDDIKQKRTVRQWPVK